MDDNFIDYFEKDKEEENPQQPHVETPEEREERELAESTIERRHNTMRLMLVTAIVLLVALLCGWLWSRYLHPSEIGTERGYVMQVTSKGALIHTIEGEMFTVRYIEDTLALEDVFRFTILADTLVQRIKEFEGTGRRVRVDYERYRGTLPWRGGNGVIVTGVSADTIDIDTTHIAAHRPYVR